MPIQCSLDFQMMLWIEPHWNAAESSTGEKLSELLRACRRSAFGVHVNHLSGAIDHHSKLGHIVRTKQTIQMRSGDQIYLALVSNLYRNVLESAVSHRERGKSTDAITFGVAGYTADVLFRLLNSQAELSCTRTVDQCNWTSAIDHECRASAIDKRAGEEVISKAALQRGPAKTFALQKRFQRSRRRGSGRLAHQRWQANDCGNGESKGGLFHSLFLIQFGTWTQFGSRAADKDRHPPWPERPPAGAISRSSREQAGSAA